MAATAILTPRQRAALPGSGHDRRMAVLKWLLPVLAGVLLATIVIWPLTEAQEFSFLLAKDKVERANERLRVDNARYRGETAKGNRFFITAAGAVQRSSALPVVELDRLSARLEADDGPSTVTAPSGRYFLNEDRLQVAGPVELRSETGYTLDSQTVDIDLDTRRVRTEQPVSGQLPIGTFRANRLSGDIKGRTLVLEGDVHLRIQGGRGRARR